MFRFLLSIALACLLCGVTVAATVDDEEFQNAYRTIDLAKREAGAVAQQAAALVRLAWPEEPGDRTVMWLAREQLVEYGNDSLSALRRAIRTVPARYQADVVATLIEAKSHVTAALPQVYLPAIEEAVWFGGFEAKRLAIPEVTAHRYRPAMITLMDASYEYPSLTRRVAKALGRYGEDKARHYLLEVMREGTPEESRVAADSLARIGHRALATLRNALRDENPQARRSAIGALLPISSIDDLSRLYDFLAANGDADDELVRRVTERAELLEVLLDRRQQAESATVIE
jgi:HEAT repeat protein